MNQWEVDYKGITFTVIGCFTPRSLATRIDPPEGGSIEAQSIELCGHDVTDMLATDVSESILALADDIARDKG